MNTNQLCELALLAAKKAGEYIAKHTKEKKKVELKSAGFSLASKVVTEIDKGSEEIILSQLRNSLTEEGIALLSEEQKDDGSRFEKEYFWCIDPLDGTLPFLRNYPGFSVSIALVSRQGTPVIGVVYDPSKNMMYHAIKGQGAYINGEKWLLAEPHSHLTYVTDKPLCDTDHNSKIISFLDEKAQQLSLDGWGEINGAGAVLNAIHVFKNPPACMVKLPKSHKGGGSVWDYAATACIASELGAVATDFHGNTIDLNKKDSTFMNENGIRYALWKVAK